MINKPLIVLLMALLLGASTLLGATPQDAVQTATEFGHQLSAWTNAPYSRAVTRSSRNSVKELEGKKKIRISANHAHNLTHLSDNWHADKDYKLEQYMNMLMLGVIKPGGTTMTCSHFKIIPREKIVYHKKLQEGQEFVTFDIKFSGRYSDSERCVLYVRDGRVTYMDHYAEDKNGNFKVNTEALDEDTETFEANYLFTPHFPAGASLSYGKWCWTIGFEFGGNTDRKIISDTEIEVSDPLNYKVTRTQRDPKFYFGVVGGLRLKYFGVSLGFGVVSYKERIDTYSTSFAPTEYGSISSSGTNTPTESGATGEYLQPAVHGYIPVSDNCSIALQAGYHFTLGTKGLSGFLAGAGLSFSF